MATWDDVEGLAMALPEVAESTSYGSRAWKVKGKLFVWERPLRKTDLAALGDAAPAGAILGARVDDLDEQQAVLAQYPATFITPHFDGYPAVLVRLDGISRDDLAELVTDAWLAAAPPKLRATLR